MKQMKKIVLVIVAVLTTLLLFGQAIPVPDYTVATANDPFEVYIPVGSKIFNEADTTLYVAIGFLDMDSTINNSLDSLWRIDFLSGSLTQGYIPYWDGDKLVNSIIYIDVSTAYVQGNIDALGYKYNGVTINPAGTATQNLSYADTIYHYWTLGNNNITILSGNAVFVFAGVPDNGQGDIIIKQNATGGYGITEIYQINLTTIYPDPDRNGTADKPTSGNINSISNGYTTISYHRIGNYLNITYGSFAE
jgi:hypothetical protein